MTSNIFRQPIYTFRLQSILYFIHVVIAARASFRLPLAASKMRPHSSSLTEFETSHPSKGRLSSLLL